MAVTESVQAVGVFLIFAVRVTPAEIASRLAQRPAVGVTFSIGLALPSTGPLAASFDSLTRSASSSPRSRSAPTRWSDSGRTASAEADRVAPGPRPWVIVHGRPTSAA
ncbi:MAG: metal ABC transporter permease [Candidatus Dormibacteraceae bacterium]